MTRSEHKSVSLVSVKISLFGQLGVPGQSRFYQEGAPLRCFNHNAQCVYGKTWQAEANIALLSAKEDEAGKVHLSTES